MTGMMAIQAVPNRWSSQGGVNDQIWSKSATGNPSNRTIRRPVRGIVLKEDSFATLRVVSGDSSSRWLIDAGSRRDSAKPVTYGSKTATDVYSNFFLQQVTEERVEKQQILETFGEAFVFLFGERARIQSFQGVLINTWDFNWEAEWWANYDAELRGTKCVENDAKVFLQYDNTLISGYILSSNATKVAQERNWVNFSFTMLITSYTNLMNPMLGSDNANPGFDNPTISKFLTSGGQWNAADLAAQRPVLIDPKFNVSEDGSTGYGSDLSLIDSIASTVSTAMDAVNSAWNKISSAIDQTELLTSGFNGGDNVRIPVGFQGALAFDDSADVSSVKAYWGEQVTFTVFSDNDDEYIGIGDQYASSKTYDEMQFLRYIGYDSAEQELDNSEAQLLKAKAAWANVGLNVPDYEIGALVKVTKNVIQTGLQVASGVQNWSAYLQQGKTPGTASGPFAAVIAP